VALEEVDEPVRIEARNRDDARAGRPRGPERDHEPHHVRERRQRHDHVVRREPDAARDLPHAGHEVGVREHDALRQAAGAARVREQRHAGGRPRRGTGGERPVGGDEQRGTRVDQLALHLRRRRRDADAGHRTAEAHRAERGIDPRAPVRHLHGQHVAGREPARGQRRFDAGVQARLGTGHPVDDREPRRDQLVEARAADLHRLVRAGPRHDFLLV
jgi:hypothetical protein